MPLSELTALLALAAATSFTPGPNTTLSTALAANGGLRAALRFVCAVPVGWGLLLGLTAAGLGQLVARHAALHAAIVGGGLGYLLWLAWRLARSTSLAPAGAPPLQVGFWQGVGLQFLNIKAWMLALTVVAGWVAGRADAAQRLAVALPLMLAFGLGSNLSYALAGSLLQHWLAGPWARGQPTYGRLRLFNRGMAAVLVLSAAWMAHGAWSRPAPVGSAPSPVFAREATAPCATSADNVRFFEPRAAPAPRRRLWRAPPCPHPCGPQPEHIPMSWKLAQRAQKMNPSVIREILKVTEKPGIISFAGGLPSPQTFPVEAMREATQKVLTQDGRSALQYAASEGYGPLREWVAQDLQKQGMHVHPDQVLITTGSQQGLDLVAKILIDAGSRILVETPTYLGALQAFTPMEPTVVSVASDDEGVHAEDLRAKAGTGAEAARFVYLLPNFQNPTGRTMTEARRAAVAAAAAEVGLPVVEDNPYGDLWFDAQPPAALAARNPEGMVYLGSFSKVLAPGLRLGYVVAPKALYPKLLQAKQAADLHTPSFNQRVVAEVLKDGFIDRHVPTIRALYKSQCEAMLAALEREFGHSGHGGGENSLQWNRPAGGMFLWTRLPAGLDAVQLLPKAVEHNVAFVPGAAFYASGADPRTLRLSFVTATVEQINSGIAALAATIREAQGAL